MNIAEAIRELKADRAALRVLAVFAACALTMAGHFISSARGGSGDIALVEPGGLHGGESTGDGADGAGSPKGGGMGGAQGESGAVAVEGEAGGGERDGAEGGQPGANGAGSSPAGGAGAETPGGGAGETAGTGGAGADGEAGGVQDGTAQAGGARRYVAGGDPAGADSGDYAGIYVYVTGAVKNPGVYELERMCMIVDAVEAAGGFTDEADAENVNMVFRIENNAMLNIKRKPAAPEAGAAGGEGADGGGAKQGQREQQGSGASISEDYDGALVSAGGREAGSAGAAARLVNINTADEAELATLPGIGKATAGKIVEHREARGGFSTIEELMDISGIKEAKFNAIKELITV